MAFEEDMIEAGYSDEQEYLDSLIDDYEENCKFQEDLEFEYSDEEESERQLEINGKREAERNWLLEWKNNNPDLSIIWKAYFNNISYYKEIANLENRHNMGLNEYYELKKWLKEREPFERKRKSKEWTEFSKELSSMYKDKLFMFYNMNINLTIVSQQAHELSLIISNDPLLWEHISLNYRINTKQIDKIEENAFWCEVYNRNMDYEFWRDNNIEKYNDFAKQWVAKNATYVYGDWLNEHRSDVKEWINNNHDIWERFKKCCKVRERNKLIESKIEEFNNLGNKKNKNKLLFSLLDSNEDEYADEDDIKEVVLYDFENFEIDPIDLRSISKELQQYIEDNISTSDDCKIDEDASRKADELMTQLWVYNNRDNWEMEALKKHNDYLFKITKKHCPELFKWWKEKYPQKWDNFQTSILPSFKRDIEVVLKFQKWALDGNKDAFISLADMYLPYWNKTLKLMYGQDIHEQLCKYFHKELGHATGFWGEDEDYIKRYTTEKYEIEIWKKELLDNVIWEIFYVDYFYENFAHRLSTDPSIIESMYTSLY